LLWGDPSDTSLIADWRENEGIDLAYSPAEPPTKDYFFQYSWVVPGISKRMAGLEKQIGQQAAQYRTVAVRI
jgi:hypothetical protein